MELTRAVCCLIKFGRGDEDAGMALKERLQLAGIFGDAVRILQIGVVDRQPDWVEALDMSPDGKWLAAGRYNGTLSLYDTKTYKDLRGKMMVFEPLQPTSLEAGKEAASR